VDGLKAKVQEAEGKMKEIDFQVLLFFFFTLKPRVE